MDKLKAVIRVPSEQYAFIEVEVEETPERILEIHDQFLKAVKPQEGIADKEWRTALDRYLTNNDMDADVYASMSPTQKLIIQEIKKSIGRVNYKNLH